MIYSEIEINLSFGIYVQYNMNREKIYVIAFIIRSTFKFLTIVKIECNDYPHKSFLVSNIFCMRQILTQESELCWSHWIVWIVNPDLLAERKNKNRNGDLSWFTDEGTVTLTPRRPLGQLGVSLASDGGCHWCWPEVSWLWQPSADWAPGWWHWLGCLVTRLLSLARQPGLLGGSGLSPASGQIPVTSK